MANAMLRSGKFLRMVTGLSRQQLANQQQPPLSANQGPLSSSTGSDAPTTIGNTPFDGSAAFKTWSLQNLQSALPLLGANDKNREESEPEVKDALLDFLVDKQKLDELFQVKVDPSQKEEKKSIGGVIDETEKEGSSKVKVPVVVQEQCYSGEQKEPSSFRRKEDSSKDTVAVALEQQQVYSPEQKQPSSVSTPFSDQTNAPSANRAVMYEVEKKHVSAATVLPPVSAVAKPSAELPAESTGLVAMVEVFHPAPAGTSQWYPLDVVCRMYREQGRYWDLECLLEGSGYLKQEDKRMIYFWTLQAYTDAGFFDRAVVLAERLHQEGLHHNFAEFHQLMENFAMATAALVSQYIPSGLSSRGMTCSPTRAPTVTSENDECLQTSRPRPRRATKSRQNSSAAVIHMLTRSLKEHLEKQNHKDALSCYRELTGLNAKVNTSECSNLIELLVKHDCLKEATHLVKEILHSDSHVVAKVLRFLLNRLASSGAVEAIIELGDRMTSKTKKEVSYDNRLCNAYLAAGRGGEYLSKLQQDLNDALGPGNLPLDNSLLQSLKDRFPRGGAMGLLESNPDLVDDFTDLAEKFLRLGYVAPMNVLWTYHFIEGRHDLAQPLWEKHVKTCPQIMFQKVCQTARSRSDADLASRLVDLLKAASTVTAGARGIANSCLIDVLVQQNKYVEAYNSMVEGLSGGISITDFNRTALKRLKEGFEATEERQFPFEIPKKSGKEGDGSVTPVAEFF